MPAIPPELTQRLRDTLAQHPALDNDRALRAVFVDARLAPWKNLIPENTPDRATRVHLLIAALCDQSDAHGENVLVLCLRVLAELTPAADLLHIDLTTLIAVLASHPAPALAALKCRSRSFHSALPGRFQARGMETATT